MDPDNEYDFECFCLVSTQYLYVYMLFREGVDKIIEMDEKGEVNDEDLRSFEDASSFLITNNNEPRRFNKEEWEELPETLQVKYDSYLAKNYFIQQQKMEKKLFEEKEKLDPNIPEVDYPKIVRAQQPRKGTKKVERKMEEYAKIVNDVSYITTIIEGLDADVIQKIKKLVDSPNIPIDVIDELIRGIQIAVIMALKEACNDYRSPDTKLNLVCSTLSIWIYFSYRRLLRYIFLNDIESICVLSPCPFGSKLKELFNKRINYLELKEYVKEILPDIRSKTEMGRKITKILEKKENIPKKWHVKAARRREAYVSFKIHAAAIGLSKFIKNEVNKFDFYKNFVFSLRLLLDKILSSKVIEKFCQKMLENNNLGPYIRKDFLLSANKKM